MLLVWGPDFENHWPEHEINFQMIWGEMQSLTPTKLQKQKRWVFLPHLFARGTTGFSRKTLVYLFCSNLISANYLTELPWWLSGKEPTCQFRRHGFQPWVRKISRRKKWQPTPVFLPGKSQGQRRLASYNSRGCQIVRYNLATKQQKLFYHFISSPKVS